MALKQFQRRTTLELGLRDAADYGDYEEGPIKVSANAVEPIGHRRNTALFQYGTYESRQSLGNETVGSQLQHDSKRVRNAAYSFNSQVSI